MLKSFILIFLIVAPSKIGLGPGAIIRRNRVSNTLTMEDVVARDDGVPVLSDVLLLLVLRPSEADVDMNLKLNTLYHLHDTVLGSKSARLTCAQP